MTAALTFTPATPVAATDGVMFLVTGPIDVKSRVEVYDGDLRVRMTSPEFTLTDAGEFSWGPLVMPAEDILLADVIALADADDLSVYEGDSLIAAPVYIYS